MVFLPQHGREPELTRGHVSRVDAARLIVAGLLAAGALIPLSAPPAAARDPVDRSRPAAPDGTPMCAAWVHDRHSVVVRGRRYATWHPPRDQRHRCAFGHEHGSSPRAFRFFRRAGMPAFGRTGAFAGAEEPHPGFKVFVANDDRRGLAWMMVLHQGSGSPRRGTVRFHSLEAWVFRRPGRRRSRRGRLLAHVRRMADFGVAVPNCPGARSFASRRLLPHPACRSAYERWDTRLKVGGVLSARPGFAIHNAITQFDPADPARVAFNKPSACGPFDPAGWSSRCKGDRRAVLHPRWVLRGGRRSRFRTDAFGRRSRRGIPQFVARGARVDQRRECCGVESIFVMERPTDGGIHRTGRGTSSTGFEHPGLCVLRSN